MSKKKVRVYKGGGQVEPLYVGSKNNARYKAYQDSLNTYNQNSALLAKYQNTLVNPEDNAPLKQGKRSGNVTVFPYKNSPTERVLVQNPIMPKQQVVVGQRPPVPSTPQIRSAYPPPNMYGQGDYTVRDETNNAFYRYPTREQADSAVNSTMGQPAIDQSVAHKQYGGMAKKRVRVIAPNHMEFGGALPNMGDNLNSYGRTTPISNQNIDTRWNYYGFNDPYAYAPDAYATKKTLPEVPEKDADIVVEKQEQVIGDFDGDGNQELMGVNTGTHASGDDQPISVPDGSFVYSDTPSLTIKNKEVLKKFGATKPSTPAQLAKKYDLQKYEIKPTDDKISAKTKTLMYQNNLAKLDQIGQLQEGMKNDKGVHKAMRTKKMKMGGPTYADGGIGPTYPYYGYNNLVANQQDMMAEKPQAAWVAANVMGLPTAGTLSDSKNGYRTQFLNAAQNMPNDRMDIDPIPTAPLNPNGLPGDTTQMVPWAGNHYTPPTEGTPMTTDTGSTSGKRKIRIKGLPGMNADTMGDLALGLKAMNLQKYKPWEPPVQAVIPEAVYTDPTRELAANSEQASMAYNAAAQSSNSTAARAAASAYQGNALTNAANIIGKYNNQNVQIANQANQVAANITNERMATERERQKSLYQDTFNANRLYQGELNQLSDELVKRAYTKEDNARNRTWINQTNPYVQLDERGFPVFNSEQAAAAYYKEMNGIPQGGGTGNSYARLKGEYDRAIAAGLSDDQAQEAAWKEVYGTRERTTYDKSGNVKSKVVSGTKKRTGGYYRK